MKKILIVLLFGFFSVGCGQEEINTLKTENAQLKAQIAQLQQENTELKDTEQNRFNRAVDLLKAANDLKSYRKAEETFSEFIAKFPSSTYLAQAQKNRQDAKNKADNIEKINNAKADIKGFIASRNWKAANRTLQSIKNDISQERYEKIKKLIEDERYKPEKTTIDKLVAEIYELQNSYNEEDFNKAWNFRQNGRRVEVVGYIAAQSIDVKRKSITFYGKSGCINGEDIKVFYDKTNLVNYFLNLNPDSIRCGDAYRIVGKAKTYSNSSDIYIQAETIEKI